MEQLHLGVVAGNFALSFSLIFFSIFVHISVSIQGGFIKGRAPGKLTGCERDLAINLPGCFCLLFLLSFIRKTKNVQVKNPTDLLQENLMTPLSIMLITLI